MELDFEVDKITESIENAQTGESLKTLVLPVLSSADLQGVTKKNGWNFNWKKELNGQDIQVYKLVTEKEPKTIQGLIALEKWDREKLVYMKLIENAPFNIGKSKMYEGVCGNLVAYACKLSFEYGFDGYVSFDAKTKLIEHYKMKLRATHFGGQKMGLLPEDAMWLINNYFS